MQEQLRPPEVQADQPPLYIPGMIRISHLASTPDGFILQTRETLRIREGMTKAERKPKDFEPNSSIRNDATKEMKQEIERALKEVSDKNSQKHPITHEDLERRAKGVEGYFQQQQYRLDEAKERNAAHHELVALSRTISLEAAQTTSSIISPQQQADYLDRLLTTRKTGLRSARKVGLTNIQVEGNTITVDVKNPYYKMYAAIPATASAETRELDHPAAVAMVVQTSDDKLVLQYRKPFTQDPETGKTTGNRFYGGIPGVSAAGYFDAPRGQHGTGKPGEINNSEVVKMASREAKEELGLTPDMLSHVAITGLAQDLLKPHDELLLFTKTTKTAAEMRQLHISEETAQSELDFAESFYTIPATPSAVEKLLTQVRVPLPPTHVAAFFAAGNALALEQLGTEKAKEWSIRVSKGIQDNFSHINSLVKGYWEKRKADVAALQDPTERIRQQELLSEQNKTVTFDVYAPSLSAQEQGLPDLKAELERTELIERTSDNAWLFDIDGVITHPEAKAVVEKGIITEILARLQRREPVAIVTGRALPWVEERVVSELSQQIEDQQLPRALLDNLYVSGEFGGSTITFSNGEAFHHVDPNISLPPAVIAGAKEITERHSDILFTDSDKQTQYTSELQHGITVEDFHSGPRDVIAQEYRDLLSKLANEGLDVSNIEVHTDRIAINIKNRNSNKSYATKQFMEWLKQKQVQVNRFHAFGDSPSDLEMGDELYRRAAAFDFYYVGNPVEIAGRMTKFWVKFPHTEAKVDKATAEILGNFDQYTE